MESNLGAHQQYQLLRQQHLQQQLQQQQQDDQSEQSEPEDKEKDKDKDKEKQKQKSRKGPKYDCRDCLLEFNSPESLDVHVNYHSDTLMSKWVQQGSATHSKEANNNNTKNTKRELIQNTIAPADSTDSMIKKSPEYGNSTTPETAANFGHPPTPQSYHSSSSPYQNADNSAFSPSFQNFQIKPERSSPIFQQQNYTAFPVENQYYQMETATQHQYQQDFTLHKVPAQNSSYRFHPYQQQISPYEAQAQVSSSSPAYPPQPTPSPSPKQCDKCGYVCDSAPLLIEHINVAHPPTPAYQQTQHFMFVNHQDVQIKTEDAQSEILDLDSHKVVHQVYPEEEKRQNGDTNGHPLTVSSILSWSPSKPKLFTEHQRIYVNGNEQNLFQGGVENKMFHQEQKLFQPHDFLPNSGGNVSTSSPDMGPQTQNYRTFEQIAAPVISSSQLQTNQVTPAPPNTKSANWKSNEARRPKTYNCTACNKWFTSSGHLKRHYNTTLHKNAVKSSGQPDPATLPISAHHHPAREPSNREDSSTNSPSDDSRGEETSIPQYERTSSMPGMIQQPPSGPYDRQPAPNINHQPLHSPIMSHNPNALGNPMPSTSNLTNLSNGSPPNGEAGLSATNINSGGLPQFTTIPINTQHGFNPGPPMMSMETNQFQMHPNGYAPHVTHIMAISNPNTTGNYGYCHEPDEQQRDQLPLPSFQDIRSVIFHSGMVNVGGGGPVTAPHTAYEIPQYEEDPEALTFPEDAVYNITMLTTVSQDSMVNNCKPKAKARAKPKPKLIERGETSKSLEKPASPEKAKTKRDYEECTSSPIISSTVEFRPGAPKCLDCDKYFQKACYLTQHNKTFHSGEEKPFKCSRCGKRYPTEKLYKDHSNKHAGEKPYKCDQCPKQFNHKTDLRRHMCLHTGNKPYACETCGKGFIRKDHMLKHCETHTRKTHGKVPVVH